MIHKLIPLTPYWVGILAIFFFFQKKQKKFARDILWASFRTTIQLILLAFALELIFKSSFLVVSLFVSVLMSINSSSQIYLRSKNKRSYIFWSSLFANTIAIWPLAFLFSFDESGARWSEPKMLLPLIGMLLGNTLNGVSIGVDTFFTGTLEKKDEILTLLALGATNDEATKKIFFRSLRSGISPHFNSMISMGIVSIPGMMAGQLISQAAAFDASILQVKMMLTICLGTIFSIYLILKYIQRKIFLTSGGLCLE